MKLSTTKAAELRLAKRALLVAANHLSRAKTRYGCDALMAARISMALVRTHRDVGELVALINSAQARPAKTRRAA